MVCAPFLLEVPYDDSCQVLLICTTGDISNHRISFIVSDDVTAVIDKKFIGCNQTVYQYGSCLVSGMT